MQTEINDKEVNARVKESMSSFAKMFGLPVSTLLDNVDYYFNPNGEYRDEQLSSEAIQE